MASGSAWAALSRGVYVGIEAEEARQRRKAEEERAAAREARAADSYGYDKATRPTVDQAQTKNRLGIESAQQGLDSAKAREARAADEFDYNKSVRESPESVQRGRDLDHAAKRASINASNSATSRNNAAARREQEKYEYERRFWLNDDQIAEQIANDKKLQELKLGDAAERLEGARLQRIRAELETERFKAEQDAAIAVRNAQTEAEQEQALQHLMDARMQTYSRIIDLAKVDKAAAIEMFNKSPGSRVTDADDLVYENGKVTFMANGKPIKDPDTGQVMSYSRADLDAYQKAANERAGRGGSKATGDAAQIEFFQRQGLGLDDAVAMVKYLKDDPRKAALELYAKLAAANTGFNRKTDEQLAAQVSQILSEVEKLVSPPSPRANPGDSGGIPAAGAAGIEAAAPPPARAAPPAAAQPGIESRITVDPNSPMPGAKVEAGLAQRYPPAQHAGARMEAPNGDIYQSDGKAWRLVRRASDAGVASQPMP